ncbi:MAG: nuclear transport factor 2 family protein [Rhodospirillales bacterium]
MTEYDEIFAIKDETERAKSIVKAFLVASMVPDPETAAKYIADDVIIHFTGKTRMSHPSEMAAYNAGRYNWVKKDIERYDAAPGDGETVVYSIGTLYGEWPNGDKFDGNRYVDRFVVRGDKIVMIDVWNDSAERILKRDAGQSEA